LQRLYTALAEALHRACRRTRTGVKEARAQARRASHSLSPGGLYTAPVGAHAYTVQLQVRKLYTALVGSRCGGLYTAPVESHARRRRGGTRTRVEEARVHACSLQARRRAQALSHTLWRERQRAVAGMSSLRHAHIQRLTHSLSRDSETASRRRHVQPLALILTHNMILRIFFTSLLLLLVITIIM
jgi:hypothetical protein